MDPILKKRLDKAWEDSKDWIAEFDGSPDLMLLVDVPSGALASGLNALSQKSENFRITSIAADAPAAPQFIPLESLPDHLARLREGKLAELSVNYAVRLEAFDLDLHLVLFPLKDEKAAVEVVWWSDQVFSEETDNQVQFAALMSYFLELQSLFSSPQMFISPEAGVDPAQAEDSWVEI